MAEMQAAADTLQKIDWGVSIFGSARIRPDSPYYALSESLGACLAQAGYPVIAGGGPGIMEAANKGAFQAGGTSIGLNIHLPHETRSNEYQTHSLYFDYFYSRKATFFMHSAAYVALPGGWGTMDEIFEVMTLVHTGKVPPAPIILMGSAFWTPLVDWMRAHQLANGYIGAHDLELLMITDDPHEALMAISSFMEAALYPPHAQPALPE